MPARQVAPPLTHSAPIGDDEEEEEELWDAHEKYYFEDGNVTFLVSGLRPKPLNELTFFEGRRYTL